MDDQHAMTGLLARWSDGDAAAFDELMGLVHRRLHRIAAGFARREAAGDVLQATAVLHEAVLRLIPRIRRFGGASARPRPSSRSRLCAGG